MPGGPKVVVDIATEIAILKPMKSIPSSRPVTAEKTARAFAQLLEMAAKPGFYGAASLTVNVQDGHVQQIKLTTERMIR